MRSTELVRPRTIDAEDEQGPHHAAVTAPFDGSDAGEVFLQDEDGLLFRLRWAAGETDGKRVLAPGTYRLKGYRVVRGDWFVSASAGDRELELEEGRTTELEIDPSIRFKLRAKRNGHKSMLSMTILGEQRMGLSIYRAGKRIPVAYTVLAGGEEVASGTMRYG